MTLTKSYNSGFKQWWSIYTWSLKKQSGVGILYLVLLCLALPFLFGLILYSAIKDKIQVNVEQIFNYFNVLFTVLIVPGTLLFVFVMTILLFRYIHNKRSTDFYHALPVSRNAMFFGRFAAGLTVLMVPIVICCCITAIVMACMQGPAGTPYMPYNTLFLYMVYLLLVIAAVFTFTVFIAVCSGTTFTMVISTIGITVAYPIFVMLLIATVEMLLPGFSNINGFEVFVTAGSPYTAAFLPMFYISGDPAGIALNGSMIAYIVWWVTITVVLFIATWLLYRYRKSENAEGRKAYSVPQIIIRTVVSGAVGIGFGYLLAAIFGGTIIFFIGLIIGAIIAHVITELLYVHSFKALLKSTPYLAGFLVLYGVFYSIVATGCFGYDTKVPLPDQVQSVQVVDLQLYSVQTGIILDDKNRQIADTANVTLQDRAAIDSVINLHKETIDFNRNEQFPYVLSNYTNQGSVTYQLKDGSTLKRVIELYDGPINSRYTVKADMTKQEEARQDLQQIEEFVKKINLIFYVEPQALDVVKVLQGTNENNYVDNAGQRELLLQMLQQDILRSSMRGDKTASDPAPSENDSQPVDENNIELTIRLKGFEPSKDSMVKSLIGDYQGIVNFAQSSLSYIITETEFPNTYQYLIDNGFVIKS